MKKALLNMRQDQTPMQKGLLDVQQALIAV